MFGVDESYDREGDGPNGGTPWDPSPEAAPPEDTAAEAEETLEPDEESIEALESIEEPEAAEPTGDERVDAALARFEALSGAPVADHVEVFEDVQRRLQDVLASVDHDEAQEPSGPPDGRS